MKEFLITGIKNPGKTALFLLILSVVIPGYELLSQNINSKTTSQTSIEAFSKGNYEEAFNQFSELLLTFSKDPLYKYYSGVCLIKMERDPEKAMFLLQEALQGASIVKTLPSDALFYLARSQQMSGKFPDAIDSYNKYNQQVGKKTSGDMGVPGFIQQCKEGKGQIVVVKEKTPDPIKSEKDEKVQEGKLPGAGAEPIYLMEVPVAISEKKTIPASYEKILDEALEQQFKADSVNAVLNRQKREFESASDDVKPELKKSISENELMLIGLRKSADQKYSEAQQAMNQNTEMVSASVADYKTENKTASESVKESSRVAPVSEEKSIDTTKTITPVINKQAESFVVFNLLSKPVTDPSEKIEINPQVPPGLIYRIQVAVFRNPVTPAYFKGITPVYGFKTTGSDITNYYAGMFRKMTDARKALAQVKTKGFNDAFVIAFSDGKRVSTDRAAVLEKDWGSRPFINAGKEAVQIAVDTVPPTLTFRVEVIRSVKPLKTEEVDKISKLAGTRGMDIQSVDDGKVAYLIGKFITFESAAEYADLLVRNGYREAKVVAWLGKREIPVEKARQLFDIVE